MTKTFDAVVVRRWFEEILRLAFGSSSVDVLMQEAIRLHRFASGSNDSLLLVRDPRKPDSSLGIVHSGRSASGDAEFVDRLLELPPGCPWDEAEQHLRAEAKEISNHGADGNQITEIVSFAGWDGVEVLALLLFVGSGERSRTLVPKNVDTLASVVMNRVGWRGPSNRPYFTKDLVLDRVLHRLNGSCAVVSMQAELLSAQVGGDDRLAAGAGRIVESMTRIGPCLRALESIARVGVRSSHSDLMSALDVAVVAIPGIGSLDIDPALKGRLLALPADVLVWIVLSFFDEVVPATGGVDVEVRASTRPDGRRCQVIAVRGEVKPNVQAAAEVGVHRLLSIREILDQTSFLFDVRVSWGEGSQVCELSLPEGDS